MENTKDLKRCSQCKSTMTYIRMKDNQRVCRHCGFIEQGEEEKDRGEPQ